jgi:hypothetical protein
MSVFLAWAARPERIKFLLSEQSRLGGQKRLVAELKVTECGVTKRTRPLRLRRDASPQWQV